MKSVIDDEKNGMEALENQINVMKAKYDLKKMQVAQLNNKLEEKQKLVNDAKKAYSRVQIVFNHN